MAGPQQFAPGLFYTPPPDQGYNAAAALWSGFLEARAPYTQSIFQARLNALDPTAADAAVAQLASQLADLQRERGRRMQSYQDQVSQLTATEQDAAKNRLKVAELKVKLLGQETNLRVANLHARSGIDRERIRAQARLTEAGLPPSDDFRVAERQLSLKVGELGRLIESGDKSGTAAALQQLEQDAKNQLRALSDEGASPLQLGQMGTRLAQQALSGVTDPRDAEVIRQAIAGTFGAVEPAAPGAAPTTGTSLSSRFVDMFNGLDGIGDPGPDRKTTVQTTMRDRQPAGGVPGPPDMSDIDAAEERINSLIDGMQDRDPFGGLGGFFDPLPGGGTKERKGRPARVPRQGSPQTPRQSPEKKGLELGKLDPMKPIRGFIQALPANTMRRVADDVSDDDPSVATTQGAARTAEERIDALISANEKSIDDLEERERKRKERARANRR